VIGLGDQAADALPATARDALAHYVQVGSLAAGDQVAATVAELAARVRIDRVECLWEPYMVLAARLREQLGRPGLTVAQTLPFRDKEQMKQLLDAAGPRRPCGARGTSPRRASRRAGRRPNGPAPPSSSSRATGPARRTPTGPILP